MFINNALELFLGAELLDANGSVANSLALQTDCLVVVTDSELEPDICPLRASECSAGLAQAFNTDTIHGGELSTARDSTIGGFEVNIGLFASAEECAAHVTAFHPAANGATSPFVGGIFGSKASVLRDIHRHFFSIFLGATP